MAANMDYAGDDTLSTHLSAVGADGNIAAVRALIAGVVGASSADDAWMQLVTPHLNDTVREQLSALRDQIAGEKQVDFGVRPSTDRVDKLREQLAKDGLDGFIVPRTDEHQGEFVAPRAERLRWLTGFSGSAGLAIVLKDAAAIFIDGRYTLQVRQQTITETFKPHHLIESPADKWISATLPDGGRLGYDPWLHAQSSIDKYAKAAEKAGGELVAVTHNPLDAVWDDQPAAPISPIVPHDISYAGRSSANKRQELAASLAEDGIDAAILTLPDSIAWLLNVRGSDVQHTPLPLSYAVLHDNGSVDWFVDQRKLSPGLTETLGNAVAVQPLASFGETLEALAAKSATVKVDPATVAAYVFDRLEGAEVVRSEDPCTLPKALKNEVEIAGTRAAHTRDGKALTRFLSWFADTAPSGGLTEIAASDRLRAFRSETGALRDLSFPTISSGGPNGAVVHYNATAETNREIGQGELYLVDSGAQYLDGTTDVTRTVAVGTPSAEMKDRFTRVLKGHIAIATARFPEGTTGGQLDTLARAPLWQAGLDFDHGTGHGVGSYLGVHEGPHRISKGGGGVALKPGMVVSNEPGYYKADSFGIRIENLVVVRPCAELEGSERPTLEFETLTLAPIDLNLVDTSLMTASEIDWLNAYHARVRDIMQEGLRDDEKVWLETATREI
jgi:Xaa-Pro aminopeptidase